MPHQACTMSLNSILTHLDPQDPTGLMGMTCLICFSEKNVAGDIQISEAEIQSRDSCSLS